MAIRWRMMTFGNSAADEIDKLVSELAFGLVNATKEKVRERAVAEFEQELNRCMGLLMVDTRTEILRRSAGEAEVAVEIHLTVRGE
jgi:hypothetical protein